MTRAAPATGSGHVDGAPGAPVDAVVTAEEPLVDQVPAAGGGVGVPAPEDQVHPRLAVALARFELLRQAVQHDEPLAPLRRDLGEATVPDEHPQHPRRLAGGAACLTALAAVATGSVGAVTRVR